MDTNGHEFENDPGVIEKLALARRGENERFGQWTESGHAPERRLRRELIALTAEVTQAIDCKVCANCCKRLWPPVTPEDVTRLSARLGIEPVTFYERYVQWFDGDACIAGGPCPFLEGNLCAVYQDRPAVCRSYPCMDDGFLPPADALIEEAAVCPIVFHVVEGLKHRFEGWRR